MMTPTTTPVAGEARRHEEDHGYGLVLLASILALAFGCFNVIRGIASIRELARVRRQRSTT